MGTGHTINASGERGDMIAHDVPVINQTSGEDEDELVISEQKTSRHSMAETSRS